MKTLCPALRTLPALEHLSLLWVAIMVHNTLVAKRKYVFSVYESDWRRFTATISWDLLALPPLHLNFLALPS